MLTDSERAEFLRQLKAAEIMAAAGSLGPITPDEAATYGWTPEEVEESNAHWTAEEAEQVAAQFQVRFSLMKKLAGLAGVTEAELAVLAGVTAVELPDDAHIPSVDVCAWCGDSECGGDGHWSELERLSPEDQATLEELHSLLRAGKAWRIAQQYGMVAAERILADAENR